MDKERLINKRFLTSGGRFVNKSYVIGKGLMKEVDVKKDIFGRYKIMPIQKRGMSLSSIAPMVDMASRSVPKSMSRRKVMDEISQSLSSMSMRGRGITRF